MIALERAISQEKAKDYLYMYSVPLGGGSEGGEECLGVMVIKSKDKTKAKQRKGALSNWKVGVGSVGGGGGDDGEGVVLVFVCVCSLFVLGGSEYDFGVCW